SILGSGGFAVVYLAFDPSLGRMVALKIPRPHALVHPELRRNFVTEAKAAAKLDHPNIVPVYEAGEDCDVPYIACACCEGPTLANWFASRTTPMKPTLAAKIVRQLASAVQFSHERGVLHRDIKPGNVLLFPKASGVDDPFPYTARLGDFGLAKLMEADPSDMVTSLLIGTPSYMAPEIVTGKGNSGDVTPDVYALGAVLYYLIVGKAPFSSSTVAESLRLIVDCDPVSPEVVNPTVGRDLSVICMKCLQKLPQHRYVSAEELGADLDRLLAGEPVQARRTPVLLRIQKWCRRHPTEATLMTVSATLVTVLLILAARYAASLQDLQGQLLDSNDRLKERVHELSVAIETSDLRKAESDANRIVAEEQVFAADLKTADSLRLAGDIRGANGILDKYAIPQSILCGIDGRQNFAWRYLKTRMSQPGTALTDAGQVVWDMKLSPDGRRIALCGDKGVIRILDPHNEYQTLLERPVAPAELNCLAWCDGESILAASGDDGIIRICNSDSLQVLRTLDAIPGQKAFGTAFLPGTTHLLVGGESCDLQLWDAASGQLLKTVVTPHDRMVESLDVSKDGKQIVTGSDDNRICMFRADDLSLSWKQDVTQNGLFGLVSIVRFTPDGKRVAVIGVKKSLSLYDSKTGDQIRSWTGMDKILALAVDADRIICGDEQGLLSQFNINPDQQEWKPENQWLADNAKVSSIVFGPAHNNENSEAAVLSAGRNNKLWLWPRHFPSPHQEFAGTEAAAVCSRPSISWLNNTTLLRCGISGVDGLDITEHEVRQFLASSSQVTCCQFAASAGCLVLGYERGEVTVVPDGQAPQPPISVFENASIEDLSVDAAATRAVVRGPNGEVGVIDLQNRRILSRLSDREASAVSPDGRWVISGGRKNDAFEIFDAATMTHRQNQPGLDSTYVSIEFTPDSRFLLTASPDRMISVWSTATWTKVHHFSSKSRCIDLLAMHPDQVTFATADDAAHVQLWDLRSGRELVDLGTFAGPLFGLSFSPNGESLAICH
ncbi:MAG: WD40 repeat domain-containing serine/threonine-protein kinase, partial [Planctomycetota bacterium]|nr:WD40 repeat domain-containing serine/threonine-protein kinase [Planctomycetota bacterium]